MAITNFVWDDLSDNLLMETDENGAVIANYTNEPGQFGEVLSQHRHGQDQYFHFDGLGSTRNLTNQNETVTDSYTYTAFGETVASSGSTPNPFKYNGASGYYTSGETGDLYVRRRTYAPSIARWLSRDPLGFFDGPNVYCYVGNFVPNMVDPTGTVQIEFVEHFPADGFEECGKLSGVKHRLTLTDPTVSNGSCVYVQKVDFNCLVGVCKEDCDEKCIPDSDVVALSFFEATPISDDNNGDPIPWDHNSSHYAANHLCGHTHAVFEGKVFCDPDIVWEILSTWMGVKPIRLPEPCSFYELTPGVFYKEDAPNWWNGPGVDGTVNYSTRLDWHCCGNKFDDIDLQHTP